MHGFPVRTPICHIAPISRIYGGGGRGWGSKGCGLREGSSSCNGSMGPFQSANGAGPHLGPPNQQSDGFPLEFLLKVAIDCAPESRNGFFVRIFFGFFAVSTY